MLTDHNRCEVDGRQTSLDQLRVVVVYRRGENGDVPTLITAGRRYRVSVRQQLL